MKLKVTLAIAGLALAATACGPVQLLPATTATRCPDDGSTFVLDSCTPAAGTLYAARPFTQARIVTIYTTMDGGALSITRWVVPADARPPFSTLVGENPNGSGPDCGSGCDPRTGDVS